MGLSLWWWEGIGGAMGVGSVSSKQGFRSLSPSILCLYHLQQEASKAAMIV